MAYPARNFEKDPSKRVKGWYMVPGKGRRYWDGKAFKYSSPDGTTNVKDMVGDRIRGLVGRIPRGSQSGTVNRRGRAVSPNKGKSNPVESGSPQQAPNASTGGGNNPGTSRTEKKDPPKPVSSAPKTAPKSKQTGDKGKDMGSWARANQKLAQRMVDRYKDKDRKPSGYASVVKALKEIKAKNVKPKSNTKVA
tara:strand:+ start:18721 stop:19299 length:579 start_codon:yes stop_codon:yes gene_type:complete